MIQNLSGGLVMQRSTCLVTLVLLMQFVSACVYNGPVFTPNVLVNEPREPVHSEVYCAGCTLETTQKCLEESAQKIGFVPKISGATFSAVNHWHITSRRLKGTIEQADGGYVVRADIDAHMPITKLQMSYEFVAYMNKCNTRYSQRPA